MKKKYLIIVFVILICFLKFLSISEKDNKKIEEHLNSVYEDYVENPNNYIITKANIIDEYDADDGFELSFFGTREWLIEVNIPNGEIIKTQVLRNEDDNLGDTIDIAYENDNIESLTKYMNATQIHYIKCFAVDKTIDMLKTFVKIMIAVVIGLYVFVIIKK